MRRLLIMAPVVLAAGDVLSFGFASGQMTSTEFAIGRIGSDVGAAVTSIASQFAHWVMG